MKTLIVGANPGVAALIENFNPPIKQEMADLMAKQDVIHAGKGGPSLWVDSIGFVIKNGEWVRVIILDYSPHEVHYLGQDGP